MTLSPELAKATEPGVTPLRPRAARLTVARPDRRPQLRVDPKTSTVRALTAALAPHLSTADPELHGLAAALLSAQQAYAASTPEAPGVHRDEVREQYHHAARDYCAALDRRGFMPPPGLLEAVQWLAAGTHRS